MPGRKGGDTLEAWAGRTRRRRVASHGHGALRFAFYGRVSTEDWQDPVTSRARQRDQAAALVAGHGRIVAEFFDTGYSRTLPGRAARKPRPWSPRWPIRTRLGRDRPAAGRAQCGADHPRAERRRDPVPVGR